jgi:hypothetical protein
MESISTLVPPWGLPLLRQLVLSIYIVISPNLEHYEGQAEITAAAARAVWEDRDNPPVFETHNTDLAAMAYWAYRESSLKRYLSGDHGHSWGPWQIRSEWSIGRSVYAQAREWLRLLHYGKTICPESPAGPMYGVRIVAGGKFACDIPMPGRPGVTTGDAANERIDEARRLLRVVIGTEPGLP